MSSWSRRSLGLAVLLAVAPPVPADPSGSRTSAAPAGPAWTFEEALAVGLAKGRVPRRLASELSAARHLFGRVGGRFRPEFEAAFSDQGRRSLSASKRLADESRVSVSVVDPENDGAGSRFQFDLFLPVFRTQALELATAEANWEATRLRNRQAEEDFRLAVARDFYDLLRAQSVVAIRTQAVERWDQNLESAKFRADIGVKSRLDFWNTKVNQANAVTDRIRAEQAVRAAMDRLGNRLGIPFDEVRPAREELRFEPFEGSTPTGWTRADLEATRREVRLAEASLEAARRAAREDLTVRVGGDKTEGVAEELSATLTYRFQLGRRPQWHDLEIARAARIQTGIRFEQQEADIVAEQREVARDLDATARQIEVSRESLELARLSYEASRVQFEAGRITQIELQNAQDKLTEANRAYESLIIDYKIARFRWLRAYGREIAP